MLEARQAQILNLVIEKHIETAEPVGSRFLVDSAGLSWSEATVRNDLRDLEEAGFLTHPHTSAGRIPTTFGYRHYVDNLDLSNSKLSKKEAAELEDVRASAAEFETEAKQIARTLVALSTEMVLLAFSPEKVYYTGLASLFQKPDFGEQRLVIDVSAIFDRCEEVLPEFFEHVGQEPKFYLGDDHPFGAALTVLSVRCGKGENLLALIGPERMNYKHNWALINKAMSIL